MYLHTAERAFYKITTNLLLEFLHATATYFIYDSYNFKRSELTWQNNIVNYMLPYCITFFSVSIYSLEKYTTCYLNEACVYQIAGGSVSAFIVAIRKKDHALKVSLLYSPPSFLRN